MPRPPTLREVDARVILDHLAAADPRLGAVITAAGPLTLVPRDRRSPFEELFRAIVYQQLSGQAAATILARVLMALDGGRRVPSPERVLAAPPAVLRGAGLSEAKTRAVQDLARQRLAGVVPSLAEARRMEDDELVARLVQVRGVGPWTVQMFLMFGLGRLDVLPTADLGVQKGVQRIHRLRTLPTPERVARFGARWAPYRTVASWYCWRATELDTIPPPRG